MAFTWSNAISAGTNAERQDIQEIKDNADWLKANLAANASYNTTYNTTYQTTYNTGYNTSHNTGYNTGWAPY